MPDPSSVLSDHEVFALYGKAMFELAVLRERVAILQSHQCQPCKCKEPKKK